MWTQDSKSNHTRNSPATVNKDANNGYKALFIQVTLLEGPLNTSFTPRYNRQCLWRNYQPLILKYTWEQHYKTCRKCEALQKMWSLATNLKVSETLPACACISSVCHLTKLLLNRDECIENIQQHRVPASTRMFTLNRSSACRDC